jgi:hypothetical protein
MDTAYAAGSSQPANDGLVGFWKDKSGNNNHAIARNSSATARPTYKATSLSGRPTLHFNGKYMTVTNSASGFDNWDKMTVFAVVDEQSANSWAWWFSKAQTFNSSSDNAWSFMARRADLHTYGFRMYGTTAGDALEAADANLHNAGIMALTYGYGKRTLHFNNDVLIESSDSGSIRAHSSVPLVIGGHNGGANGGNLYISEFLVYNEVVSGLDRQIMEGYPRSQMGSCE